LTHEHLSAIDTRIDLLTQESALLRREVNEQLGALSNRVGGLEQRVGKLERRVEHLDRDVQALTKKVIGRGEAA
jgi:chaperonin cofactor prefoldin